MDVRVVVEAPQAKKVFILGEARWRVAAALSAHERHHGPRLIVTLDYRDIYYLTLPEPVANSRARRGKVPPTEQGRISALMGALAEAPLAIPGWTAELDRSGSGLRLRFKRLTFIPPAHVLEAEGERATA